MKDYFIRPGDRVEVRWASSECVLEGHVVRTPSPGSDPWIIVSDFDGAVVYVQNFETMTRLEKEEHTNA